MKTAEQNFDWLDKQVEGLLNDFESGESTLQETKNGFYEIIFDKLIKQIQEQQDYKQEINEAKPKWISVKDRLPENVDDVLVFSDYGDHTDIWVSRVDKYWDNNSITHWMPLPESPKENT